MAGTISYRKKPGFRIARAAVVVLATIAFGTIGFAFFQGWNLIDSLFMTVMTLTTVGYEEVHPLTQGGKIFAIVLMLTGIGVVGFAFSTLLQLVVESEVLEALGVKRRNREMNKLSDHFIICGAGRMGSHIIKDIERTNEKFVVIENDVDKLAELTGRSVPFVIQGDATLEHVLREAGVVRARALVACLTDDADNVYTVLVARDLNPGLHIVARAVEEQAQPRLLRAGADRVVAPTVIGAKKMAIAMRNPGLDELIDSVAAGELDLHGRRVEIASGSALEGQKLSSTRLRAELNIVIVSVSHVGEDEVFNPPGNFVFENGDAIFAIGSSESLARLKEMAGEGDGSVASL